VWPPPNKIDLHHIHTTTKKVTHLLLKGGPT
jgi:hypothetical protein